MKVKTLNKLDFEECMDELSLKIAVVPDVIVQILNAGTHLGLMLKAKEKFNKTDFCSIRIQRSGERIKQNVIFRVLLKGLPYSILNFLRRYESKKARNSIAKIDLDVWLKKEVNLNVHSNKMIKNILIIDDAIDTGQTMFLVKNNLKEHFPEANIKTAVLSWTLEDSIIKPDFYIFKNVLVRFPWSKDYKCKDFEQKSFSS